jgi:hypothetical protein
MTVALPHLSGDFITDMEISGRETALKTPPVNAAAPVAFDKMMEHCQAHLLFNRLCLIRGSSKRNQPEEKEMTSNKSSLRFFSAPMTHIVSSLFVFALMTFLWSPYRVILAL